MEELDREATLPIGRPGAVFDPNRGASGRPPPYYEHGGGPSRVAQGAAVRLTSQSRLKWNGFYLTVESTAARHFVNTIDVAPGVVQWEGDGSGRAGDVVEAVLFIFAWRWDPAGRDETNRARSFGGSLHFLNAKGYSALEVDAVGRRWRDVTEVLEAAGMPLSVYVVPCGGEAEVKISRLLFPRRAHCTVIR